jgi:hypothetical protein
MKKPGYAKLDENKNVIPVENIEEVASYWADGNFDSRRVNRTEKEGVVVSTVFLVLNHGWGDEGDLWFETLVFSGEFDGEMDRYETWDQAIAGHEAMCKKVFKR